MPAADGSLPDGAACAEASADAKLAPPFEPALEAFGAEELEKAGYPVKVADRDSPK